MADISQLTVPVNVNGTITVQTLNIKDSAARQAIADLGNAVYWAGVTTTTITNGGTTNPVIINGVSTTVKTGGMVQYDGEEFIWNGSAWQSIGKNNFGSLAFKNSASSSYTPAGTVSTPTASLTGGSTTTVNSITGVGTLPVFSVSGEALVYTAGTLPTKGADTSVVSSVGSIAVSQPSFTGTQTTITVS